MRMTDDGCLLICMSGKMGAGKDTVAPLVMDMLRTYAGRADEASDAVHVSFSDALHTEVDRTMRIIMYSNHEKDAASIISRTMSTPMDQAFHMVDILWSPVHSESIISSRDRSTSTREAMQYWGTEVRRASDADYWVNIMRDRVRELMSEHRDVYITDARFPNEANLVHELNGMLIRLDVTPEEQERRIKKRDSITLSTTDESGHPSEILIDDYPDYDARILTDGKTPMDIAATIAIDLIKQPSE